MSLVSAVLLSFLSVISLAKEDALVSPIVQRQLEASVVAHSWPWTLDNVYCEAWAYQQQLPENDFMDDLVDSLLKKDVSSVEEATSLVLSAARNDVSLMKYSLSLRAHSPACEAHRVLARQTALKHGLLHKKSTTCNAFAVIYPGEIVVTDPSQVSDDLTGALNENDIPLDLLLPGERVISAKPALSHNITALLYGNMGTKDFCDLYQRLRKTSGVDVAVRHLGVINHEEHPGVAAPTVLQGYGVRLDIRNVEYRAFDDEGKDENDQKLNVGDVDAVLSNLQLAGVNVSALDLDESKQLKLQRELWKRHEAQQLQAQLIPPKWQRRQLPLQAAAAVVASQDVLLSLLDVSQNLPSVASTLVHVPVDPALEELADSMSSLNLLKGRGALLLVNGKRVQIDRPSFNVFELLQLLLNEQVELQSIEDRLSPYMNPQALKQVYKAWVQGDKMFSDDAEKEDDMSKTKSIVRIDVGRGWKQSIMYLNDIEQDDQYRQWPTQVQQMIMAAQFGQPPAVRRNMYTILAVVDPFGDTNPGFQIGIQTMKSHYPVRTGILLVNEKDVQACASWLAANPDVHDDDPCPVPSIFDEASLPMDSSKLNEIEATTQMVHRIVSQVMSMYAGSGVAMAYVDYLLHLIEQHNLDGEPCMVSNLLELHGQVMNEMQFMEPQEAMARATKTLQDNDKEGDKDGDGPRYGRALRFAVSKNLKPGMSFLNGRPLPLPSEENAQEMAGSLFMEEQSLLFGMIMQQEITDTSPKSIYGKLLTGDKVFKRVHPLLTESKDNAYIDLSQDQFGKDSIVFPKKPTKDAEAVFVVDVVLDLSTEAGIDKASNIVDIMDVIPSTIGTEDGDDASGSTISVGYRFLPSTQSSAASALCPIMANAGLLTSPSLLELLQVAKTGEASAKGLLGALKSIDGSVRKRVISAIEKESSCTGLSYLTGGTPASEFLVANGRLYVPDGAAVTKEDIELLLSVDLSRTKGVTKLLKPYLPTKDVAGYHDVVSRATSFLAKQGSDSERRDVDSEIAQLEQGLELEDNPLRFNWNDDDDSSDCLKVKVTAVVDPISETTQRLAPLLFAFRDELKLPLSLIMAPPSSGGDEGYPITSYYRFVADPNAAPDANPARAQFENLPANHVLTLRMDVPEPWNVQQTYSVQDTDNLRCDISSGCGDDAYTGTTDDSVPVHEREHMTRVEYGLKDLLFFGQCYDTTTGSPPNGLPLTLSAGVDTDDSCPDESVEVGPDGSLLPVSDGDKDELPYSDTLVMKTVGYWQLRATPGVWKLSIAKGSRGADIFDMVEGTIQYGKIKVIKTSDRSTTKTLVMKDFVNSGELLLVKRRPGFERASLFYEDDSSKELEQEEEVINVFSLATGHLYERFLKIMMLSVTKRTSSKVKFWLFENFLSPSFKATATDMAEKIGCEVEFVTYKWPEWLRGQSEKQRIIWGYKILFLDVLFPLGVKKIIYVDADQVVRGDLKELWDMDLQGAPYGYTPFCDSRETTLGFQFWRSGFWKSHLRGKPYHISALYVVDLEKFRRDLVGDQLRSTYQQLSADPHSLSNLDQDLPNYAQHAVPIFSLPQEWLWCESWCSDETKASAKTIDLCNNPLHKEPKVSMAKRVISGDLFNESWIELDAEVERYEKDYLELQAS